MDVYKLFRPKASPLEMVFVGRYVLVLLRARNFTSTLFYAHAISHARFPTRKLFYAHFYLRARFFARRFFTRTLFYAYAFLRARFFTRTLFYKNAVLEARYFTRLRLLFCTHTLQRACLFKSLHCKVQSTKYNFSLFRSFVVLLLAISIVWIPIIQQFHNAQLFVYVQVISAFFQPPIAAVFVLAMLWHRVTEPVSLLSLRFMNIYHIKSSLFYREFFGP